LILYAEDMHLSPVPSSSPQVKELPAYLAVAANTSGSTPKNLFEDVADEIQKQVNPLYLLISS